MDKGFLVTEYEKHLAEADQHISLDDYWQQRIEALEDRLTKITQWCDAYPRDIFIEPTKEEWALAARVLKDAGLTLDAISASNMRHVVEGLKSHALVPHHQQGGKE